MADKVLRFPRTSLWSDAAELQERIEEWLGRTAVTLGEMRDRGMPDYSLDKVQRRYVALEVARDHVTKARVHLFTCP